ncbi:hypothetical protein ABET41_20805 [Metabacillus fastidiosus]|uniref:Uncharacterized protein n=1 Tax=Metabacillus fastidiosus TaxID=1458 RepID=A0ABU6P6V1_9BACI|nr:hypothetical protein [Metabacillus fastidiosus]
MNLEKAIDLEEPIDSNRGNLIYKDQLLSNQWKRKALNKLEDLFDE